jgi:hypothetical protein
MTNFNDNINEIQKDLLSLNKEIRSIQRDKVLSPEIRTKLLNGYLSMKNRYIKEIIYYKKFPAVF